eukprot:sb/3469953/
MKGKGGVMRSERESELEEVEEGRQNDLVFEKVVYQNNLSDQEDREHELVAVGGGFGNVSTSSLPTPPLPRITARKSTTIKIGDNDDLFDILDDEKARKAAATKKEKREKEMKKEKKERNRLESERREEERLERERLERERLERERLERERLERERLERERLAIGKAKKPIPEPESFEEWKIRRQREKQAQHKQSLKNEKRKFIPRKRISLMDNDWE